MKQEQLIDLPIEWKRGNGLRKSDLKTDGKNKCVLYGELFTKHKQVLIDSNDLSKTNKEGVVKSRTGDILIPGTSTAAKKDMLLAREIDEEGVSLGGDINILRPKKGLFAQKYVPYYFETKEAYDQLDKYITGATGIIHISNTGIKNLTIPLPSVEEQGRIVGVLDEAFLAIDKTKANAEQNLRSAKELFESHLQEIFENKSPDWEEKKLSEVYDVRDGTHDSPKYVNEGYALVTSKNLKNGSLNYDKIKYITAHDYDNINKRSRVDVDDVLFAMIGTIGNPIVIENEPDYAIKNVALFKVPNNQDSYFLKYYLDSNPVIEKMTKDAKGTTQKFVSLGYLRSFLIYLPPLEKQQEIVNQLNVLRAKTQKLEEMYQKKIDDLDELKKSILQKAFAGELTDTGK